MSISFNDEKDLKRIDDLKKAEEEQLVEALASDKYSIPYINLSSVIIENESLRSFTEKEALDFEVAPFKLLGKNIHVALRSPIHSPIPMLTNLLTERGYVPHFYMASSTSLKKVWERYKELANTTQTREGGIDITSETLLTLGEQIKNLADVKKSIEEVLEDPSAKKISRMLEIILAGAIAIDASDIHIEPEQNQVRLRYRLDGVLQDVTNFDEKKYHSINSRIKLLSGLKLTQESQSQDGRFSIFIKQEEIGIRTSIIPGAYGEGIVMRLLNPKATQVKLEDLGIEPRLFEIINREIERPNGLLLITGPTGSGKTTTLYSFLRRIYSDEIKIITIEDPIEYHLEGVTQTQTDEEKGYTFAEGLRSALRQDPDVMMVGEIRDAETAGIAINSALTGHMVFSTLHTNNAAGVIPRLIDLGVNPKILVSALTASIAQRLVRKLCNNCKKERTPNEGEVSRFNDIKKYADSVGKNLTDYGLPNEPYVVYEAVGCEKCNFTGYKGRIGVFEAILTDETIEKIIPQNPSEREIRKVATEQKILTMREDGLIKILKGVTSLEEVASVVDLDEE